MPSHVEASGAPFDLANGGERPLRIAHTIADLDRALGGPSRTVPQLCDALSRAGATVSLFTHGQADRADGLMLPSEPAVRTCLCSSARYPLIAMVVKSTFHRALQDAAEHGAAELIHDHGTWLYTNHCAALTARRAGLRLVISPRGMLSPWSLRQGKAKKRLAMWLYERSDLRAADLLVATSDQELQDIRALDLKNPVAVIPNGIPLQSAVKRGRSKAVRTMFFLSRIHPKKGLIELVQAWRMTRPSGWRLMIGGPDEGGHRSVVEKAVKRAGLTDEISFVGPLDDSVKYHYYGSSDAFILPTHSENFGVVIAEALASGLPVITTRGAPWDVLLKERCGWWVENRIESLAGAISQACSMSDDELRTMGERGRLLVQRNYSWEAVAQKMIAAYAWLLRGTAVPSFVHTR